MTGIHESTRNERPGVPEALLLLTALVALELALARVLPPGHSTTSGVLRTGWVRLLEIGLLLGCWRARGRSLAAFGLRGPRATRGRRQGLAISAAFGAAVLLAEVAGRLALGASFLAQLAGPRLVGASGALLLGVGVLIGPLFEELLFRGYLYGALRQHGGPAMATALCTAVFALAHGATSGVPWVQAIGGILFCVAYERSGSLWSPLLIHASANLALFTLPHWLP